MMKRKFIIACAALAIFAGNVYAQEPAPAATAEVAPEQQTLQPADPAGGAPPVAETTADPMPAPVFEGGIDPNSINPIVFSYWERAAINDARQWVGKTRAPTEDELMRSVKTPGEQKKKPPPEEREIKLGGIVFVDAADWAIWLNGKRVTPDAIPREVMDLKVYKEYVEMKWFDDYTNQIFPLRIRAHERFNIDTRIFLPG
jgi:hypothetical protein